MTEPTLIQIIGAALFGVAVLHTFCTRLFERLAHRQPRHAGIWHLAFLAGVVVFLLAAALPPMRVAVAALRLL